MNNHKELPKCRAVKHHFKINGSIESLEAFFLKDAGRLVDKYLEETIKDNHLFILERDYFYFFERYSELNYLTQNTTYGNNAIEAFTASNQLFDLRVQRWTSDEGTKMAFNTPVPDYLPDYTDDIRQVELVVSLEEKLKLQWNIWIEMVCYALSIRSSKSLISLMSYTEQQAWEAERAFKKRDFSEQHPMFVVRYLKAMLQGSLHRDLLYQQLTETYVHQLYPGWTTLLEPYYFIAIGDEEGFVDAMYRASMAHKKFVNTTAFILYSKPSMNTFSPYLLGAAVHAFDTHGWEPIPNNDYLYPWWVLNKFELPFDMAFSKKEHKRK